MKVSQSTMCSTNTVLREIPEAESSSSKFVLTETRTIIAKNPKYPFLTCLFVESCAELFLLFSFRKVYQTSMLLLQFNHIYTIVYRDDYP
jgi:hypothetical protein